VKDLVELFEDQDREFRSDWVSDEARCDICRQYFPEEELQDIGEQMIDGVEFEQAKACSDCVLPEEID
jgi:Pyruvate/2-oxoacid:ferredoxin oxidoreductase delta subunit